MKPNELKITVEGLTGSGKSGIGFAIEQFLRAMTLDATFCDLETANSVERSEKVIRSLAQKGTKITIVEKQATWD